MFLTRTLLLSVISLYRRCVSPLLPSSCRFHPSCSDYAAGAIRAHGPLRGVLLALGRLARCHPWNPGGFDPVPESGDRPGRPGRKTVVSGELPDRIVSS